jgi:hypothetical protein
MLDAIPEEAFLVREAFSTRGVIQALDIQPAIIVIDLADLLESNDFPRPALAASLESIQNDGIPVVGSATFLAEQEQLVSAALLQKSRQTAVRFLPSRTVLVANYAGGVGKTTLAMSLAKGFQAASGLGTAFLEMGIGGSALNARLSGDRPSLYTVVTQNADPDRWSGIDLYPLDGREAQVLADDGERTLNALEEIILAHTLTVMDAFPANPLWPHLLNQATDIFVVTSPRPDSIAQTDSMLRDLNTALETLQPKPRLHLTLNMVRSWSEKLPFSGQVDVSLPFAARKAERYHPDLADPLLERLYPGWSKQRKRGQKQ